jgi:para-nitrobenzyl esterase
MNRRHFKVGLPIVTALIACLIGYGTYTRLDIDNFNSISAKVHQANPGTLRDTVNGPVIGFSDSNDTFGWTGIPYAAPPLGDLRWRAPQPIADWQETLPVIEPGIACTQIWTFLAAEKGAKGDIVGSEDCLTLNVWSPQRLSADPSTTDAKLPVMVWIHGGGNSVGSSRQYQGQNLAEEQKIIFVSVNYRLGLLGSFTHKSIRSTAANALDASGNYGLLDIIAALNWIKSNIHAFGGDANNVTVFGESAGGRNIFALLASPLAKGLFHKAITQSGSVRSESLASAENYIDDEQPGSQVGSNELLARLLVNQGISLDREEAKDDLSIMTDEAIAALLYQQPADRLIVNAYRDVGNPDTLQIPQLLRDGYVLPDKPFTDVFGNIDEYNGVPMIIGANRDEEKSFMARDPNFVKRQLGFYPSIIDKEKYERFAGYYSARWYILGVTEPAKAMQSAQVAQGNLTGRPGIYTYRFDWDESPSDWIVDFPSLVGAGHGLEIGFIFKDFVGGLQLPFLYGEESAPGRTALSKAMMNYWGQFAYTGSPGRGRYYQQPEWTAWAGSETMIFDSPDGGGWRMEKFAPSREDLTQQIEADKKITDQLVRCQLYVETFLMSYHSADFWDPERYKNLGGGGCANQNPYQLMEAF